MNKITKAVDFLNKNNSLIGNLDQIPINNQWPWPDYGEADIIEVDWKRLFPDKNSRENTNNPWHFPQKILPEMLNKLDNFAGLDSIDLDTKDNDPKFDTCAWYQPIHYFEHDWGIFIKEECIKNLMFLIVRKINRSSYILLTYDQKIKLLESLFRASTFVYFIHEHYHHKIECLGFRLHVANRTSSYIPYHQNVYFPSLGTDGLLEESLANAYMFLRLNTAPYFSLLGNEVVQATKEYLKWHFDYSSPPGYRMAKNYLNKKLFNIGENILKAQVNEGKIYPSRPPSDWNLAPHMTTPFFNINQCVSVLVPSGTTPIIPAKILNYGTCSSAQLVKIAEQHGYTKTKGGKGSHIKLIKPNSNMIIIPGNRGGLRITALKNTLTTLGIKYSNLRDFL